MAIEHHLLESFKKQAYQGFIACLGLFKWDQRSRIAFRTILSCCGSKRCVDYFSSDAGTSFSLKKSVSFWNPEACMQKL